MTTENKEKNKGGRPPKPIDEKLVYELALIHCTNEEIAAICECSTDTLERRFAGIISKAKEEGKSTLRRIQFNLAKKGNVQMLIWLGKQLLGQRDKFPEEITPNTFNLTINKAPY